jgi:adenylosuccinate lyase
MIERYQSRTMLPVWSEEHKYRTWLKVELAVCRAWMEEGVISPKDLETIERRADFDIARIEEIERDVHHDVIAFVSAVAEKIGNEGRLVHLGLTSSDVIDTAASLVLMEALDVIDVETDELMAEVLEKAKAYRHTPCVGRTHGVHAEPTTFGLKILNWYAELERDRERISFARKQISCGKVSGAVGTYAHCPPSIESRVCDILGLIPAKVSNQILQRDRHAGVLTALALLGGALERMSVEIRHLQRTEVLEAAEPFGKHQKGSSAMPHKRNPILCERVSGMSRLLRGYASTAMENIALWHERDISHSSVERVIWPDAFHIAAYMLETMRKIVAGLTVSPESMRKNLGVTRGLVFSQKVLLGLVEGHGLPREEAYAIVQENAMKCWDGAGTLEDLLGADPRVVSKITREELHRFFDLGAYYTHVDEIFKRFDS